MILKKGDKVKVLTGKDKKKDGEIIEIDRQNNRAKVKGINIVKKHVKATKEKKGGIISKENFINISNLKMFEKSKNKTKEVKPKVTPSMCGIVFLIPKLNPEYDATTLFGPGV